MSGMMNMEASVEGNDAMNPTVQNGLQQGVSTDSGSHKGSQKCENGPAGSEPKSVNSPEAAKHGDTEVGTTCLTKRNAAVAVGSVAAVGGLTATTVMLVNNSKELEELKQNSDKELEALKQQNDTLREDGASEQERLKNLENSFEEQFRLLAAADSEVEQGIEEQVESLKSVLFSDLNDITEGIERLEEEDEKLKVKIGLLKGDLDMKAGLEKLQALEDAINDKPDQIAFQGLQDAIDEKPDQIEFLQLQNAMEDLSTSLDDLPTFPSPGAGIHIGGLEIGWGITEVCVGDHYEVDWQLVRYPVDTDTMEFVCREINNIVRQLAVL